ncbi:MAG: TonB-dependent receptor [Ignavibacteria bacterium]|nr:TonB-dependent receptor [Ignavibacteria bacterium]
MEKSKNMMKCHSEQSEESSPNTATGFFTLLPMTFFLTYYKILLFLGIIFFHNHSNAAPKADSIKLLKEVVVTADRLKDISIARFMPTTKLGRNELNIISPPNLSDALAGSAGVHILDYGGWSGIKTISLRGTTSSQTLFLLDGMRLNSNQTGSLDLSNFPVTFLEGITILRGGASAALGGNSMGGAVDLNSNSMADTGLKTKITYGSYNDMLGSVKADMNIFSTKFSSSFEFRTSDGNFPFLTNQDGKNIEYKRQNGDFRSMSFVITGNHEFEKISVSTLALVTKSNRGSPGAVLQGRPEEMNARLNELNFFFYLNANRRIGDVSVLTTSVNYKMNEMEYSDSDSNAMIPESNYYGKDFSGWCSLKSVFQTLLTEVKAEVSYSELSGNFIRTITGGKTTRKAASLSASADYSGNILQSTTLAIHVAARVDGFSDVMAPCLSPFIGFVGSLDSLGVKVHSNWSYNFRTPSLNEMYFFNYGNDSLMPERAHSINAGVSWDVTNLIRLEADGFLFYTSNQIVSKPIMNLFHAVNIAHVFTRGIELSSNMSSMFDLIDLKFSYTRQYATNESDGLQKGKELIYIPSEMFNSMLYMRSKYANVGIVMLYTGFCYWSADNSIESVIPSRMLINVFVMHNLIQPFTNSKIRLDCYNLFDTRYEVIKNYPMPGRSFRISLSVDF